METETRDKIQWDILAAWLAGFATCALFWGGVAILIHML